MLGVGRWVLGVFWALGPLGRRRRGLRTGYFAGGLRTLFRSTSEVDVAIRGGLFSIIFWVLGVGCWALGVRQGRPGGSGRRRGHFTGTSMASLEAQIESITTVWSESL